MDLKAWQTQFLKQNLPVFNPGDTVKVFMLIRDESKLKQKERTKKSGEKSSKIHKEERVQIFEGIVIARRGSGLSESFVVRRVAYGVGIERVFPLHSPLIQKIEVIRKGDVRRAKLYYQRIRKGKAARIKEKLEFTKEKKDE
jgi:large subunit ribosomal protein L19